MTKEAIQDLSNQLTGYVLMLGRCPTAKEFQIWITEYMRNRKNGK